MSTSSLHDVHVRKSTSVPSAIVPSYNMDLTITNSCFTVVCIWLLIFLLLVGYHNHIISCYHHFNDSFLISVLLLLLCRPIVCYLSIQLLHCITACFIKLTYLLGLWDVSRQYFQWFGSFRFWDVVSWSCTHCLGPITFGPITGK